MGVPWCLDSVALFAFGDVFSYGGVHCRPVEIPRHLLGSFENSEVIGFWVVVQKAYDFVAKKVIVW
jgi:hypothetical protein